MYFDRRAAHVTYCVIAVRRSRDEDQQLESNVDDRLCPAPDPTTAGALHPPIKAASTRPRGCLHLDRRIDFSAICFGMLLHLVVAESIS
jgi:hypothetical protein